MPQALLALAGGLLCTGGLLIQAYKWVSGQDMLQVCSRHLVATETKGKASQPFYTDLNTVSEGFTRAGCCAHRRVVAACRPAYPRGAAHVPFQLSRRSTECKRASGCILALTAVFRASPYQRRPSYLIA